jgi:hypothetical protein
MTEVIANSDEDRRDADRAESSAETKGRGGENQGDGWRAEGRDAPATHFQRPTTRLPWEWAILVIGALSVLFWAALIVIVIAALSAL